jgi:hypothetical protein
LTTKGRYAQAQFKVRVTDSLRIEADILAGYRMQPVPTALLQRWYSLVREKRSSRQDFLKALVKVFDVNVTLSSSQACSITPSSHDVLIFFRMTSILPVT